MGSRADGKWEMPGGRLEPGETPRQAAVREWEEETGIKLPPGEFTGHWKASNGRYIGFVYTIPSEDDLPIFGDRDDVFNPDGDPDGDITEALAWWDPKQLKDNPALRAELAEDVKRIKRALAKSSSSSLPAGGGDDESIAGKSARTPIVSTVHHHLGEQGLWHTPSKKVPVKQQLPAYLARTSRTRPVPLLGSMAVHQRTPSRWRSPL